MWLAVAWLSDVCLVVRDAWCALGCAAVCFALSFYSAEWLLCPALQDALDWVIEGDLFKVSCRWVGGYIALGLSRYCGEMVLCLFVVIHMSQCLYSWRSLKRLWVTATMRLVAGRCLAQCGVMRLCGRALACVGSMRACASMSAHGAYPFRALE